MAKYVYYIPSNAKGCREGPTDWQQEANFFGQHLQEELAGHFGLHTCVYPEEDGIEVTEGSAWMGKDWFNFKFRIFANAAIYLDMINIPYEWRGKGLGEWLISELKKFAAEHGLGYIFLGSYDPSNYFWERLGFERISQYPDFVLGIDQMAK